MGDRDDFDFSAWLVARIGEEKATALTSSEDWRNGNDAVKCDLLQAVLTQGAQELLAGVGSGDEMRITSTVVPGLHECFEGWRVE